MAEAIVSGLVETITAQLASLSLEEDASAQGGENLALEEEASAQGVEKEVRRLENTLAAIKDVLPHAENLQFSNNGVKSWLRRIKDAAYDAEDVIDDFATETLRKKLAKQGGIGKRVRHFASSSNYVVLHSEMAHRIKEARENLKDIFDDHQLFGLQKGYQENCGFISEGRQTHSYIPEGKVVGRDAEKERIVKLLLDSSGRDSLSVIPILGMGGIGKTTLAQFVYNDERVIHSFKENRMWVCVSDEFDLPKIIEKIIRSGTNEKCSNLELDQLQSRLRQHLGGKRYLLVLDDIWNEELDKWEELRDLLIAGAGGSKIIVTTRSKRVGSLMGTTTIHRLSELSEGDCWNLFKRRAFEKANEDTYFFNRSEEDAYDELVKIGKEIAKKCGGVPLAAKTLGGLCYQAKRKTWEFVRDNDVWRLPEEKNGILRALRISYNHLSFSLKQCFAYCSIFPKDYYIEKDMLIRLWIAQGFIIPLFGENRLLEEIGNEYVEILMWRSFFQEPEVDDYDNLVCFKMHDLVHDLAQCVVGVECFSVSIRHIVCLIVSHANEKSIPNGVRHLVFEGSFSLLGAQGIIPKPSNIRTLMFDYYIDFPVDIIFSSLKFLRVLKFGNNNIEHLPDSIEELKHLRYLQIKGNKIRNLPESITNLQSLQVLKLECSRLEKLPSGIQNMISLRHIEFGGLYFVGSKFYYQMSCSLLSHIPWGLGELNSLQTLSRFVVGKDKVGCDLNGLNGLTNLGGKLEIRDIGNVKFAVESREANLKMKTNLQDLTLIWGGIPFDIARQAVGFEVLENLEPPSNLKNLEIYGYVGTRFPKWMMELPNVVRIELYKCNNCKQLPRFSHLPSLKVLKLLEMNAVECIEGRPEENQNEWFPSLTKLEILNCPNLKSWFGMEAQPQQEEELSLPIPFPSLVDLSIFNCPKVKTIPPLASSIIKTLFLEGTNADLVHSLVLSPNSSFFTSLKVLNISGCEGLGSWPSWFGPHLTSLRELYIGCTSLHELYIGCTPSLPCYCEEALPEWMPNFTSLQKLSITGCPNLQILPEWMANCTSLQELSITGCPNLQILPEWVLTPNTTIQYLYISECPHLKCRYNKHMGEDRHKLAHIPDISVYS